MEHKTQLKEMKIARKQSKNSDKSASVRVRFTAKKLAIALLEEANRKKMGRSIKIDELLELALSLVTNEHLKLLQEKSLTNEDRKEILRQKYVAAHGPISKDEFTGFMMTQEFLVFMTEQGGATLAAIA